MDALLCHLAGTGFDGAPRSLGRDQEGRHVLEYIPGDMADALPAMTVPSCTGSAG